MSALPLMADIACAFMNLRIACDGPESLEPAAEILDQV
jgi:hypothetical protein